MIYSFLAMVTVVAASNFLVEFPINDWLTWGSLTYPFAFSVTEMTVVLHGAQRTRRIVYAGFCVAVVLSIWLATPRIALASGSAFLFSQLLDIFVFRRMRQSTARWWAAPLCASVLASILDGAMFWGIAFGGENVPLMQWALTDTAVKLTMDLILLTPFRLFLRKLAFTPTTTTP